MKKILCTLFISIFVVLPSYKENKKNEVFSQKEIKVGKERKEKRKI